MANQQDSDILIELEGNELQKMADCFTKTEDHKFVRTLLLNIMRNRKGRKQYLVNVYTPTSKPEGNEFVFCFTRFGPTLEIRIHVLYPAGPNADTRVSDALFNTGRIQFEELKEIVFRDIDFHIKSAVENFMEFKKQYELRISEINNVYTLKEDVALGLEEKIPEDAYITRLEEKHANLMFKVREHPNLLSSEYFRKTIRINGGYVINSKTNNEPIGWGLKTLAGGIDYVDTIDSVSSDVYAESLVRILSKDLATSNPGRPVLALTFFSGKCDNVLKRVGFKQRNTNPQSFISLYYRIPEYEYELEQKKKKKKKKKKSSASEEERSLNTSDIKISPVSNKGREGAVNIINPVMTRHIPKDEPQPRPSRENSPRSSEESEYEIVDISLPASPSGSTKIIYEKKVDKCQKKNKRRRQKLLKPGPSTIKTSSDEEGNDFKLLNVPKIVVEPPPTTSKVRIPPPRLPEIPRQTRPSTRSRNVPSDIFEPRPISPIRTRSSKTRTKALDIPKVEYPTRADPPELSPTDTCGQPTIKEVQADAEGVRPPSKSSRKRRGRRKDYGSGYSRKQ
ncbi:uncharacterized protein LOC130891327 [Diorhabda carinulata]|uniref:uncharacterized protein LOC130891327 n=1 Tax=Diorhabda carinulata TaxID=1163345 RepID=UPI0025A1E007|nr:uncharacterized protein LOC130891327 [Diorhabda carinulata]